MLARLCGAKPILVMVDGNFPEFFSGLTPWMKSLALQFIGKVEALAVQSPSWKEYFDSIFPETNKEFVQGGIDTDFFFPRSDKNPPIPTILYVGWMIEAKGIYDLLDAAKVVADRDIAFQLKMIGPAFGHDAGIRTRIRKLGLQDRAFFAGPTSTKEELRTKYQEADIFVFPSHFEGFPVALLEAVACGLPCISTDVGGCPDILDGGKIGILVKRRSVVELAEALSKLIQDPQLRREMGEACRGRALVKYNLQGCLNSYATLAGLTSDIKLGAGERATSGGM